MEHIRINLWSTPRNVSTALMYSFAQREDTQVFDEPLYAHYLLQSGDQHPGREETLQKQENDGNKVVEDVLLGDHEKKVLFFKQMSHHLINLDTSFIKDMVNILLVRNPAEIIHSYAKVNPHPTLDNVGLKKQYELYSMLKENGGITAIIDAKYLLRHPDRMLENLCDKIGIPFDKAMLSWSKGARPEDGSWGKYWYKKLHKSTGFRPYQRRDVVLDGNNRLLANRCMPYYIPLLNETLK